MPFNIWCLGCDNHIGMGVRFNAEKKTIGKYLSTPLFSFRMKCHLCSNWIEIHTDPKTSSYLVVSGARKKVEDWAPQVGDTIVLDSDASREKAATNAMFKLERMQDDKQVALNAAPALSKIAKRGDSLWKDNYAESTKLRSLFRQNKLKRKEKKDEVDAFRQKYNIRSDIPILECKEGDDSHNSYADSVTESSSFLSLASLSRAISKKKARRKG